MNRRIAGRRGGAILDRAVALGLFGAAWFGVYGVPALSLCGTPALAAAPAASPAAAPDSTLYAQDLLGAGDVPRGSATIVLLTRFRCEELCPRLRRNLAAALSEPALSDERSTPVLLLSVDLEEDASVAAEAETRFRREYVPPPAGEWRFIAGTTGAGARMAAAAGLPIRREGGVLIHPLAVLVCDARGRIAAVLPGPGLSAARLIRALRDTRSGVREPRPSAAGAFCPFDPSTAQLRRNVLSAIHAAGAATALGLAFLIVSLSRSRRPPRAGIGG